eukprot:11573386-Ditylum_brightwellii.AAC.1
MMGGNFMMMDGKAKSARGEATRSNLLPATRKGTLDPNILQCLGLVLDAMKEKDALLFIN